MWDHLAGVLYVVRCGDEDTVRVPLRAFVACGPDWNFVRNRFVWSTEERLEIWFPMPMPAGGVIELEGARALGELAPGLEAIEVEELEDDEPLLFRAGYHLAKGVPTRPFSDHVVLDAKGRGRFLGCSLLIRNPSRIWWGEGDEKFWVDGETFPSWFGTGTEDYFGYAWCEPTPFSAPFHAQVSCEGPQNFGFTQLLRTHVLDSVPFRRSFRFELERWHWRPDERVDYATVAYWYGAAGATSGLPAVPSAKDRELPRLPAPRVFRAANAIEGETLRVVSCSRGSHEVQDLSFFEATFSGDAHRWWRDGGPDGELKLALPISRSGRHRITVAMTKAEDFGIVQLSLNGQALGEPFDGYAEQVGTSGPIALGNVELEQGEAVLTLKLVGSNPAAKPRHMVGLDYLRLERLR